MTNIFKNAYFGKPYRTRGDKKAIYLQYQVATWGPNYHVLAIEEDWVLHPVYKIFHVFEEDATNFTIKNQYGSYDDNYDIISEWQPTVDEQKLDELSTAFADSMFVGLDFGDDYTTSDWNMCKFHYEEGYRDALRQSSRSNRISG